MSEEERFKLENELLMTKSKAQMINLYLDKLEELQQKENIIKGARDILRKHICNPSGLKKGWRIDCWNNEDISKLNEDLGILDKEVN